MYRYKLIIQYDGTRFHGWQIQKNHNTIQKEIEKSLSDYLSNITTIVGAGRTDSGVHALGQVAHFDSKKKLNSSISLKAINARLPDDIQIVKCKLVDKTFHARFSAKKRFYIYRIRTNTFLLDHSFTFKTNLVDIDLLNKAAEAIKGRHDFTSFSKFNKKIDNRVCTIYESVWKQKDHILNYHICGNRFLHHMVRYLVGTMIEIARKRYNYNDFLELLNDPKENVHIFKAPSKGLILEKIVYED